MFLQQRTEDRCCPGAQLYSNHQSQSANVADDPDAAECVLQCVQQISTHSGTVANQIVFVIGGERGKAGGTSQWVAAKGAAVDPYEDMLLYMLPKRNGPNGNPPPNPLAVHRMSGFKP